MTWKIRKIDHGAYSTTLFLHIVLSVTAGLSSYFWGILSSSENLVLAAKTYARARFSEDHFTRRGGAPIFPVTVLSIHDHNVNNPELIDRRLLADLIRNIARFEPAVIGVDYILDRAGPRTRNDEYLLRTLRRENKRIVIARPLSETSRGFVPTETRFLNAVLKTGVAHGITGVHHKRGENPPMVRKTRMFFPGPMSHPRQVYPAFAFCLFLKYKNVENDCTSFGSYKRQYGKQTRLLNFRRIHPALLFNTLTLDNFRALLPLVQGRHDTPLTYEPLDTNLLIRERILRKIDDELFFHTDVRHSTKLKRKISHLRSISSKETKRLMSAWNETYPPQLKNKVVIIGSYYSGRDLHHTTLSEFTNRREHGMILHARVVDNLIHQESIRTAPPWLNLLVIVSSVLLTGFFTWRLRTSVVLLLFALYILGYIALNWLLFLTLGLHYTTTWVILLVVISLGLVGRLRALYTEWDDESTAAFAQHMPSDVPREITEAFGEDLMRNAAGLRPLLYVRTLAPGSPDSGSKGQPGTTAREMLCGQPCLITYGPDDSLLIAWSNDTDLGECTRIALAMSRALSRSVLVLDHAPVKIRMGELAPPVLFGASITGLMNVAALCSSSAMTTASKSRPGTHDVHSGTVMASGRVKNALKRHFRFRRKSFAGFYELKSGPTKRI